MESGGEREAAQERMETKVGTNRRGCPWQLVCQCFRDWLSTGNKLPVAPARVRHALRTSGRATQTGDLNCNRTALPRPVCEI